MQQTNKKVYDLNNLPDPYTFKPLNIDPEFEKLFPELTNEEFRELKSSIAQHGFDKSCPIVTWQGYIVDGHNRYKVCRQEHIPYVVTLLAYETKEEVFDWMYRIQIGRRNLTAIQKVEISLKMKPVYAKMAKEKQVKAGGDKKSDEYQKSVTPTLGEAILNSERHSKETDAQLAKIAGIGKETFRKGAKILESDNEKLKQKVKSGNMSINAAYKELMGKQKPVPKEKKEPVEPKKDGISDELRKICEDIKTPKSNWFT